MLWAGQLTARKDRLVSNENLARIGVGLGLESYIALPWKSYSFAKGCVTAPVSSLWPVNSGVDGIDCIYVGYRLPWQAGHGACLLHGFLSNGW